MHILDASTPGGRFHVARKRAGLTQIDVAKTAGVAQSTVSDFETGKIVDIMAFNLAHMCVAVSVPVEYVLLGSRAARDDEEAEVLSLLRGADDGEVRIALKALRGMLRADASHAPAALRKQAAAHR